MKAVPELTNRQIAERLRDFANQLNLAAEAFETDDPQEGCMLTNQVMAQLETLADEGEL